MRSSAKYGGFFDYPKLKAELEEVEDTIAGDPNFWNDPDKSAPILKRKKSLENSLKRADRFRGYRDDLEAALELAEGESEYLGEAQELLENLEMELIALEIQSLLGEETDKNDAVVTINAGAGGTESCDWASMLYRMYLRFCERSGWEIEVYDYQEGDEAGLKSVTFEVSGDYAFGMLKAESGVHRLVRISPFDSNARRHTSFASLFVSPVVDDNIDIEINEKDLRIDTYRASGAGGQHVNRTDSAVRITHNPSGIVVQCQTQRSQHQNREQAMKLLRSRLYELELEKRRAVQQEMEDAKSENAFGSQIRSYVLHPYKMVKDHRTNYEHRNPDVVLDGGLNDFVFEFLARRSGAQ